MNTQYVEQIHMCKTDNPRSVIFLFALQSFSCRVKVMYFSQISLLFLTELLSRDAVHNIAGMLFGILKRLRTSRWRITWKEKIQHELSIYPLLPFTLTFFLAISWRKCGVLYLPFKKKKNWSSKNLSWRGLCLISRSEHFISFCRTFQSLRHQRF